MNPDAVKLHIDKLLVSNQTKQKLYNNYDYFVKNNCLEWKKPVYHWDTKVVLPIK